MRILILTLILIFTLSYGNELVPCKVLRVVDGDTFVCLLKGKKERVRLIGVDTPESRPNKKALRDSRRSGISLKKIIEMGKKATRFTKKYLKKGKTVFLEFDIEKRDRYGRLLAYVWLDKKILFNELIIREGYATVYTRPPNVKYVGRFLMAQRYAREKRKGLWAEDL